MRVATFNCNSIRQRLPIILDWLAAEQPDVLGLQETKVTDDQFPAAALAEAGWHVAFRGEKSYNGVALISREPLAEVSFGLQDEDDGESGPRLAIGRLGSVWVLNAYVPQGQSLDSPKFAFKLAWLARFRRLLEARFDPERDELLWIGDLNVAPTSIDVYDSAAEWGDVCHCQEVIDAFGAVTSWGLRDVFRQHLPGPEVYTYWDYRVPAALKRGIGWRIDHIQATAPLAAKSVGCRVDLEPRRREKPSDHTFVVADFAL